MNLEDHLGDIIGKARTAANVSVEDAAKAAGLTVDEFSKLEESGKIVRRPNFEALGGKLGLHPGKLEGLARGWLPQEHDLSIWRELRQVTTAGPGFKVNCYLVWDEVSREGALFDTGWEAQPILELITENHVQLRHLFLTHSHEDHLAAMQALGSYEGGRMLFLGLGTGLGSALIVDGSLAPMELAHLPYKNGEFEDYVGARHIRCSYATSVGNIETALIRMSRFISRLRT